MLFDAAKYGKQRKTEIKNDKDKSDSGVPENESNKDRQEE